MAPRAIPPSAHAGDLDRPVLELSVGRQIKLRRMLAGLTQAQLATLLGVTYQHVHQFERGYHLNASRLYAIAKALVVPVEVFFPGVESNLSKPALDSNAGLNSKNSRPEMGLVVDGRQQPEILAMVKAFRRIKSLDDRMRILAWVNDLAGDSSAALPNLTGQA